MTEPTPADVFADGIAGLGVYAGVVRFDLVTVSTSETDDHNRPAVARRQRVLMPVEGFVRSVEVMRAMIDKLNEAGLVARRPDPSRPDPSPNAGD